MHAAPQPAPTPAILIDWALVPIPLRATGDTKAPRPQGWQDGWYLPDDWRPNEGIGLRCGLQLDGTFLYVADFDHKPEQGVDAPGQFAAALERMPEPLRAQLFTAYSTSRRGRYIAFKCDYKIPSTYLRDEHGKRIGDFLGAGRQVVMPTPDRWINGTLESVPYLDTDEVRTLLAALNYRKPETTNDKTSLDWSSVPAVAGLLDARKLPTRLSSTCPAARLLLGREPAKDTSHARYVVIYDLVRYGYSDQEIGALAAHLCDWGTTQRKGRTWLEKDIERIIPKCRAAQPATPKAPAAAPAQKPLVTADGGRPRKLTHEAYMLHLRNNSVDGKVLKSQSELADDLKVCRRTIQNWEKELRAAGRIQRHTLPDGKHSYVAITDAITEKSTCAITSGATGEGGTIGGMGDASNVNNCNSLVACDTREEFAQVASDTPCWACAGPVMLDATGVGRCTECGEPPIVPRLVEEALEATVMQRHTPKRRAVIVAYVHAAGRPDATPDWIAKTADDIHREWQQQAADAKLEAELAAMPYDELDRRLKAAERRQAYEHERGSPGAAWVHGRRAWFIRREWDKPERAVERELQAREKAERAALRKQGRKLSQGQRSRMRVIQDRIGDAL